MNKKDNTSRYLETPIGLIPKDWEVKLLGDIGEFFKGKGVSTKEVREIGKPAVRYGEIYTAHNCFIKKFYSFVDEDSAKISRRIYKGDLLFAGSGETVVDIGKCVANLNDEEAYAGGDIIILRPNGQNSKFLGFLLNHSIIKRQTYKLGQGNSVVHIYSSSLKKIFIPVPPSAEQESIANVLSVWDDGMEKLQSLIKYLNQRNKGLAQQLLTGKRRLKGFSRKWQIIRIGDVFQIENRHIQWDGNANYNLVSIRRRFGGLFFRGLFNAKEIKVKKLKEIKVNDFLISKRQVSHGAWSVVPKEFDSFLVSDEYDCLSIVDPDILSSNFWKWFCQQHKMTNYAYLDSKGVHIEKLIFHFSQFRKRKLKIPDSLAEQEAVASILDQADLELKYYKKKLVVLKEQKRGLMQKLLTGQVRVKTN